MTISENLNKRFAIEGEVSFQTNPDGLIFIEIKNRHARATIAMQGAHLMGFQPHGHEPMIWLSPEAKLKAGKSIRGGVPVCWPWFGPHQSNPKLPAHGFARTVPWRLNQVHALSDGSTRLEFELVSSSATQAQWPHNGAVRNIITIGKTLQHELVTSNHAREPVVIGEALHTYFRVGDIRKVTVHGLHGCDYLDKVKAFQRLTQSDAINFRGEVDRIYLDAPAITEIRDPSMKRRIVIRSHGSRSTVIWNPWIEKAAGLGDMGPDGYLKMLCVETANAAEDTITLAPGAQHRLVAQYSIEAL